MDAQLEQRIAEGRKLLRESVALDAHRAWDQEMDQLRRGMQRLIDAAEGSPEVGRLRVGDVLEWLAGVALIIGAFFATGLAWPAVLVAGVFMAYQAQCFAGRPVRFRKKRDE